MSRWVTEISRAIRGTWREWEKCRKHKVLQNWMRVCDRFQRCFHLCVHKSVPCWPSSALVIVSLASSTKKEGTIFQVSMVSFRTLTFTDLCPILSITKPWTFVDPVQTNVVILSNSSILYLYYRLSHKLYTFLVSLSRVLANFIGL